MPAALYPQTMNIPTGGCDFLQLLHSRLISRVMLTAVSKTSASVLVWPFLNFTVCDE